MPQASAVRLEVFDTRGRRVFSLIDEERAAGYHHIVWKGQNSRGMAMPSGVYYTRLSFAGEFRTGRMTLVR